MVHVNVQFNSYKTACAARQLVLSEKLGYKPELVPLSRERLPESEGVQLQPGYALRFCSRSLLLHRIEEVLKTLDPDIELYALPLVFCNEKLAAGIRAATTPESGNAAA